MGLPLPCMRSGRSLWLENDHSAERLGTPKALVVRPVRGMRGRCRGCASRQRADGRTSPSADRIQRRSRMFPGQMRADTQRPPLPGGEVYAQRSGRARIRRNLGLTLCGLPGCWPRWPFGPFRCTISVPRGMNDEPPSDVYPVQVACRCLRSVTTLRPDPQYPARLNELCWNPLHARSAADE